MSEPDQSGLPTPPDELTVASVYASGGKRRGRVRKRHTIAKVMISTFLVLGLISGLGSAYLYRHLDGNLNHVDIAGKLHDRPDKVKVEGPSQPLNILLLGSDSRDCKGCNLDDLTGDGARSDTTILVHLSADHKHAYGVSIPRDSMVDRPACTAEDGSSIPAATYQQWNAAYSVGGDACTVEQFEQLSGIQVDNTIDVNFESFQSMVDAVGGVSVCIPETIDDREHGIYLPAGTRTISGKQALSYVRVRHGVGDGSDLSRIKRQQAFLASLSGAVLSGSTLSNPVKILKFLDAATKGLTTDANLKQLAQIGFDFRHIGLDKIQFITIPIAADPQDANRVVWTSDAAKVWTRLKHDRPLTKALSTGAIKAGRSPGAQASASGSPTSSPSSSASSSPSSSPTATPTESASQQAAADYAGLCS